jgi:hypothetical protein
VFKCFRFCLAICAVVLAIALGTVRPANAGAETEPVSCWIQNLSPEVQVGAQASYVIHLSGGLGSYSINLAYGDGTSEGRSVSAPQASFAHWFASTGVFNQLAHVSGAGSCTTCTSSTSVY